MPSSSVKGNETAGGSFEPPAVFYIPMVQHCDEQQQKYCDLRFDTVDKSTVEVSEKVDRILLILEGNGKPGLRMDIDRLKEARKRHIKFLWIIATGVCGLIFSAIGHWIGL